MNCNKCGNPLMENDQFCRNCGASVNDLNAQNLGNNNYQQMYNQPPRNNNMKFILIGAGVVIVIIAIIAAIIFGISLNNSNNNNIDTGLNNSNIVNQSEKENSGATTVKNNSTYKVNFNGFTFKIPTDLVYEEDENAILVGNEDGTWVAYIEVVEGVYNQLLANKNQLQSVYIQRGYDASSAVEKTIGNMPFITLELSKNGTNGLVGIARANSMNLFGLTAFNIENEFDYDLLKTLASILSNAEYTGETNNMSTFEKVDLSEISNLAK